MSDTLKAVVLAGAALLTASVGVVSTGLGLGSMRTERYLDRHATEVAATVRRVDLFGGTVELTYVDDHGASHRATVEWNHPLPRDNGQVTVQYDPRRPAMVRQPGSNGEVILGAAFLGSGALLLVVPTGLLLWRALAALRRARRGALQR